MKYQSLAMACLIFASTAAIAQSGRYTATLVQPLAARKDVIANGNLWRCEGSTCTLTSVPQEPFSVRSCLLLQRQTGELSAYGVKDKAFDAERLAQCNAKA